MSNQSMTQRPPIIQDRVRKCGKGSFAFIPHRFLQEGFLASLTDTERSLYLFLVLAADRRGMSFWGYDRICTILELHLHQFLEARNALIDKDLVAFDSIRFQVLELPAHPVLLKPMTSSSEMALNDPATVRALAHESLYGDRNRS